MSNHIFSHQNFNLYLEFDKSTIEYNDLDTYIYNKDGSIESKITECNLLLDNLYKCNAKIDYSGNYSIQSKSKAGKDFNIMSNQVDVFINDLDIEIKNIGLNKKILENISLNYAGSYFNLEEFNDYIFSVKSEAFPELHLNEILIFDFQSFWFLILLLLIIEWIVRKNKGLL